ncbi:MAG: acyl-ACP--UDP-N-acetylglucosamine O-acyltransferase [Proteobacteria bacterium]|nr:acyl-ACP--UDP-N-acetylglucosamine O-acyltransferase [Pseudomonadota bacterium]
MQAKVASGKAAGKIHPTAIVEKGAKIGAGVVVGPYCVIGGKVEIGADTRLVSHVVLAGRLKLGKNNVVYPFASLGQPSPDRKYDGEDTLLQIGDGNDIREGVTMHIGTAAGGGKTLVGHRNLLMAGSHVAHDCVVGDDCILANYAQLAGHVTLGDKVVVGGLSGIHQRVRVGSHAIVGGHTAVDYDVPPFASVAGRRATLKGLNLVGLRRRGFDKELIHALDEAYDFLFAADDEAPLQEKAQRLRKRVKQPEVRLLAEFVMDSQRGVTGYDEEN